jgi:hypothetical protein
VRSDLGLYHEDDPRPCVAVELVVMQSPAGNDMSERRHCWIRYHASGSEDIEL